MPVIRRVVGVMIRSWLQLLLAFAAAVGGIGLFAIVYAQTVGPSVLAHMTNRSDSKAELLAYVVLISAPVLALMVVVGFIWAGVVAFVADGTIAGRRTSLTRAGGASLRRLPAAAGAAALWMLVVVGTFVLAPLIALAGIVAVVASPLVRRTRVGSRLPARRVLLVIAIPWAVWVLIVVRLSLVLPAVWLDGLGTRAALTQSWERVKGSSVVVGVVLAVASLAAFGLLTGAALVEPRLVSGPDWIRLAQIALQLLVAPLPVVSTVVLYRRGSTAAPVPDAPEVAPLPGSRRRQAAVATSVAIGLQVLVWAPATGIALAVPLPAQATPKPVDITLLTFPASPFESGVSVDVHTEVWDNGLGAETGGPTGTVVLYVDGGKVGEATLDGTLSNAALSLPVSFTAGPHTVTSAYSGDTVYAPAQASITVTAGSASTTVLTVPGTASVYGNPVTLVAEVSSATGVPTGPVQFVGLPGGAVGATLSAGRAEVVLSDIPPGSHIIQAVYNDPPSGGSHLPSTSATGTVAVLKATTTTELTTVPTSPSAAGTNVQATVTVTAAGTPVAASGSVTLYDGGLPIASGPVASGSATLDLALAPGTHDLLADFVPAVGFNGSSGDVRHVVSPFGATVDLSASSGTSVSGEPVTLTATVPTLAGFVPTGDVQFFLTTDGTPGAAFATVALDPAGSASVTAPPPPVGSYQYVARYLGDRNYAAATSAGLPHTVGLAPVVLGIEVAQPAPAFGDRLDVKVTITPQPPAAGRPTGAVTLLANGTQVGSLGVAGTEVNFTFTPVVGGTVQLEAVYSGDAAFQADTATLDVFVAKRSVTIGVFPPPSLDSTYGEPVRIDGFVSSGVSTTPTGAVALTATARALGETQLDASGRFSFTTDRIQAGANIEIVATYQGDAIFEGADTRRTPLRLRVLKADAKPVLTASATAATIGDVVTLTVDLDDIGAGPSGSVTFSTLDGPIGTAPVVGGTATIQLTLSQAVTFVSARYEGDANFIAQETALVRIDAGRADATITMDDPGVLVYGGAAILRARVDTPPGVSSDGFVTMLIENSSVLKADVPVVDGVVEVEICGGTTAVCPPGTPVLDIGAYRIQAVFGGSAVVGGATAAVDLTVTTAETTTALSASTARPVLGTILRLTATVTATSSPAVPSGRVSFDARDSGSGGLVRLGTAALVDGVAVLDVQVGSNLSFPIDTAVARYEGAFRSFRSSSAVTPVSLDRQSISMSAFVLSAVAGIPASVSVDATVTEPGLPSPYLAAVTVTADNGEVCRTQFALDARSTRCSLTWRTAGVHSVVVSYPGDPTHEPFVSEPFPVLVGRRSAANQWVSAPRRVLADTAFSVTWTFDRSATGTMTVPGQPGCDAVPIAAGRCSVSLGRNEIGRSDTTVRVRYSGDANWHQHEFELSVVVGGCYPLVLTALGGSGTMRVDTPTNCTTDLGPGYLAGSVVSVVAAPIAPYEFVRWQQGTGARSTRPAATFRVTDDFRSRDLDAVFQYVCFPVGVRLLRGELGSTDQPSMRGTVQIVSRPTRAGTSDGSCQLVDGGAGFEFGTPMTVRVFPEFNPYYGEADLFYGFGDQPAGATVGPLDRRFGTIDFVVDGPVDLSATLGPRCRAVTSGIDPVDESASVTVVTSPTCASPYGDGYRAHAYNPYVSLAVTNDDPDLHLLGWSVNGQDARELGAQLTPTLSLRAGDLDVVARFGRCDDLTLTVDGALTPALIDGENASLPRPVGDLRAVTPANCPDGSARYLTGTEVTVLATASEPAAQLTWSDNVQPSSNPGEASIVVDGDTEVTASFFLPSVCSRLTVDDPYGLVTLGRTGCGDGYYLDRRKVWDSLIREELSTTLRSDYPDQAAYERVVARTTTSRSTRLPLSIEQRFGDLDVFADAEGVRNGFPDCFPMDCLGPVTGPIHITVSPCQQIQVSASITVKDDPSGTIYLPTDMPATTFVFDNNGVGAVRKLRPWIESTDVSAGVQKLDASGNFQGFVRTACESFENAHPPGAELSVRAGAVLAGLYVESWTDEVNIPVNSPFGFEYQTFLVAEDTPKVQTVNADFVAVCRTVTVGAGITIVDSPPNCPGAAPGSRSYLVGSFVRVRAEEFLGPDINRATRYTKELYEFSEGLVAGSQTTVKSDGQSAYFEPYTEAIVFVDGHKTVSAKYASETDQLESAVVTSLKLIAGVVAIAVPVLFTSFICAPCGMALGALALASTAIDLIPGTDGKATAALDLINPMSVFQCAAKWGANTPTPPSDPIADPGPPITAIDELNAARRQELESVMDDLAALGDDPPEGEPPLTEEEVEQQTDLLIEALKSYVGDPADLKILGGILQGEGLSIDPENFDLDDLAAIKAEVDAIRKMAKAIKKANAVRKLGTAFVKGYVTNGIGGTMSKLSEGVRRVKEYRRVVREARSPASKARAKKLGAAADFMAELHEAGYLNIDGLARNNGTYQNLEALAGTSTFTDCLDQKYRIAGGLPS